MLQKTGPYSGQSVLAAGRDLATRLTNNNLHTHQRCEQTPRLCDAKIMCILHLPTEIIMRVMDEVTCEYWF